VTEGNAIMSNAQLNSLVMGRAAGTSFGVPERDLGRLSLVAYTMGNPVLAIFAAKSMAKGDKPSTGEEQGGEPSDAAEAAQAAAEDAEAAKDAAEKAGKAALAAQQEAVAAALNAKNAADTAEKAAAVAQQAAADAQKAAGQAYGGVKSAQPAQAILPVKK
jgi:hypothetical protein